MSEDFSQDFVIEEEEDSGGSSRSFLIGAGALIGVFIILAGCLLTYVLLQQRGDSNAAQRAEIESINATTEANNQIIELTNQAQEAQQALAQQSAQATAEAIGTADAQVAELPATSTPEVQETTAADAQATSEAEAAAATTAAQEAAATAEADATATAEALATAADASGTGDTGTGGTGSAGEATGGDTATALPQTGVEVWLIAAAAMGLIALLFIARRLRTIS